MFTGIDAITVIPRRRWTAVASFSVQAAVIAAALAFPLLHPTDLPEAFKPRRIFVPITEPQSPAPPTNPHPATGPAGTGIAFRPIIVNRDNGVHFGPARPTVSSVDNPPDLAFNPAGPGGGPGPNFGLSPGTGIHPFWRSRQWSR